MTSECNISTEFLHEMSRLLVCLGHDYKVLRSVDSRLRAVYRLRSAT